MASSKIVVPCVVLVLRLLALLFLAGSLALLATDKVTVMVPGEPPSKFTFKDVYAYRYVLAIAAIGCAYTLLQIPPAAVSIAKKKRVIGGSTNVALFLICADVVFALAFATGVGVGYGFTYDVKRYADSVYDSVPPSAEVTKLHRDMNGFFARAYAAAGLMMLAAKCTAFVVMISVYALVR